MPVLLILFGAVLIFFNIRAIKKDENSFGSVLKCRKEDISDVEIQVGEIRRDVAESLTELQTEILEIKKSILYSKQEEIKEDIEKQDDEREFLLASDKEVVDEINKKSKTERIKELLDLGLNEDEICEKLSLGKGEVLLVKGLFKE